MFNIGLSELIVILLVAFLIVGPNDLPKVARALGRFVRFLKTKWAEFIKEADLEDTIKEFRSAESQIKQALKDASPIEELKKARDETTAALREAEAELKKARDDTTSALLQVENDTKRVMKDIVKGKE